MGGHFSRFFILLSLSVARVAPVASAHPSRLTGATLKLARDGRFELRLEFDALAFLIDDAPERIPETALQKTLTSSPAELDGLISDARERLRQGMVVSVDGRPAALDLYAFPTTEEILRQKNIAASQGGLAAILPLMLEAVASGQVPPGNHRIEVRFPEVIGTVVATIERPGREALVEPVEGGEPSPSFEFAVETAPRETAPRFSSLKSIGLFITLGFRHIVPNGLDHILFVLGLFLLSTNLRALLWQVTAFTLAHSITLGLSLYGVFRLPPTIVEPLIAISIVLIACDNLRSDHIRPVRVFVVFGFGLIHGLGFAGALRDLHLGRGQFAPALFGFNLGIELGQLAVIALAFLAVGWARQKEGYRRFVIVPASVAIGLVAIVWTVQRVF